MNISKKDLAKEIRCLRVHLTPTTSAHFIDVLKEAEKRLIPGAVSTVPVNTKRTRISQLDRVNKYLAK